MTSTARKKGLGESDLLKIIQGTIHAKESCLETGIGDDSAVLRLPGRKRALLFTTDILNEGIHFRREWTSARLLGFKSLAVNQSDIAAMGGKPLVFVVNLSLPQGISSTFLRQFYGGIDAAASRYGGMLAGGDLSRSPKGICLSISMIGETWSDQPILRQGARPGDALCLAGWLGMSAIGLHLLKNGSLPPRELPHDGYELTQPVRRSQWIQRCLYAHLAPFPMVQAARYLVARCRPTAMMDVSDGLSMDLTRLCRSSRVGAEVEGEQLPVCPLGLLSPNEQQQCNLHGGEDYALLFTLPQPLDLRTKESLARELGVRISIIGRIVSQRQGIKLFQKGKGKALPALGFDHFLTKVNREYQNE